MGNKTSTISIFDAIKSNDVKAVEEILQKKPKALKSKDEVIMQYVYVIIALHFGHYWCDVYAC